MLFTIGKLPYWPQWLVGVVLCFAVLVTGLGNGWTSPYLAQLTAPDTNYPLKLTAEEASWVASFLNLGRFIGSIFGATAQGFIGRKRTILLGTVPMVFGWTCIMVATSVPWLYAARLFLGTASGTIWSGLALFISEIADPKIRGSLIFLNLNAASIGAFLGNLIGSYLPMEHFSCVSLVLAGLFIVLFSFVPETPYHHIVNGNALEAEKSLRWYKEQEDVKQEIRELQKFAGMTNLGMAKRFEVLKKPIHRKNLGVMFCLSIFLYCAGNNTMSYYAEIIVTKSDINLNPGNVVVGLSFCTILAGITATIIVDKLNRRTLLAGSGIVATIALAALGFHFHMLSLGVSGESYAWLPITSLILYNLSLAWGLVPIPCALISEIFPPTIKTLTSMSLTTTSSLLSFATAKGFQPFLDLVGEKYVFWTFSISSLASALFTWFFVPETRGKSLIEIQNDMTKTKDGGESVKKCEIDVTKVRENA